MTSSRVNFEFLYCFSQIARRSAAPCVHWVNNIWTENFFSKVLLANEMSNFASILKQGVSNALVCNCRCLNQTQFSNLWDRWWILQNIFLEIGRIHKVGFLQIFLELLLEFLILFSRVKAQGPVNKYQTLFQIYFDDIASASVNKIL